ncbi:ATPase [Halobacteriales archaeon SW_10_66_29]|nr:MAG: ATPase [Halobacteriales archaeon SW_10_66_29]
MSVSSAREECETVLQSVSAAVVADESFLETVLTAVLAEGHVLIEDVPGTGKTLTARSFASALGLSFSRIQFTPDLLPGDITGTHVYREDEGTFTFTEGPIFANFVLADEINRAPPKTQAALLEAMAERQVTVDGETRPLPEPFVVIATQNPVESEGVFPLPAVLDADGVRRLQAVPESVTVDDDILDYIVDVVEQTRTDARVEVGVSPRGTQRLLEAARARAVIEGRSFVRPVDVTTVARPVLGHRLIRTTDATVDGTGTAEVLDDVLDAVSVPTVRAEDGEASPTEG